MHMAPNSAGSYIDTDVIIRLLTGDDLDKQKTSADLFEKVSTGKLILSAPDTVIADAVYVLSSPRLYNFPRTQIRDVLTTLLRLPNFKVDNKQALVNALDLYADTAFDFGDTLLIVLVQQSKNKSIYSFDHDFDKIPGIKRREP